MELHWRRATWKATRSMQLSLGSIVGTMINSFVVVLIKCDCLALVERVKKLKFSKRLFVMTTAGGEASGQIEEIADLVKDNQIGLNIFGIGFDSKSLTVD